MKKRKPGNYSLEVSAIGLGSMSMRMAECRWCDRGPILSKEFLPRYTL
jgi:hypothetical protein